MNPRELTPRQRTVLEIIAAVIARNGFPPTIREIATQMCLKSTNAVAEHLDALERKGYIVRDRQCSRGIRVLRANATPRLDRSLPRALEGGGRLEQGVRVAVREESVEGRDTVHVLLDPVLFIESGVEVWRLDTPSPGLGALEGDLVVSRRITEIRDGDLLVLRERLGLVVTRARIVGALVVLVGQQGQPDRALVMEDLRSRLLGKVVQLIRTFGE